MNGRERRSPDRQATEEAGKAMHHMSGPRPVSGIFNSTQPRGGSGYGRAFGRARLGRTGALGAGIVLAAALAGARAPAQTPALPVVTITADATQVREGERAQFTIQPTGATTAVLRGSLYVAGANPALDYEDGWAFAFRTGEAAKGFGVTVLGDGTAAADRQVTVRVDHLYDTYIAGTPSSATMTVIDASIPAPPVRPPPVTPPPVTPPPVVVPPAIVAEVPADFELPSDLRTQMQFLGDRVRDPSKAWTAMNGAFTDAAKKLSQIRVIQQTTGQLRVEGLKPNEQAIEFDGGQTRSTGTRSPATLSAADRDIVETFAQDSMIGLLAAVDRGAAAGLLGRGFRPDASVAPNYAGPSFDIFELVGQTPLAGAVSNRGKRFYFDSDTGLLLHTRYQDGVGVETRFSNWTAVDGSMYPFRIERYENDIMVFSFAATTITASGVSP